MKVSVIVPVYNTEKYLRSCLDSLVMQTYPNKEIILINDGSSDHSEDICTEYAKKYSCIRYYNQKNEGICAVRNKGISLASGDYIVFVDSDDIVPYKYIEKMVRYMQPGGLVAVGLKNFNFDNDIAEFSGNVVDKPLTMTPSEAMASTLVNDGIRGFAGGKMFDAKLIREKEIYYNKEIAVFEDMEYVLRYLLVAYSTIVWNRINIYYYRYNPESIINSRYINRGISSDKAQEELRALEFMSEYVKDDKKLSEIIMLRKVKSSITALRIMEANKCEDDQCRKRLLSFARRHMFQYLCKPYGARSSKISVLTGCISPKLEFAIWKRHIKRSS